MMRLAHLILCADTRTETADMLHVDLEGPRELGCLEESSRNGDSRKLSQARPRTSNTGSLGTNVGAEVRDIGDTTVYEISDIESAFDAASVSEISNTVAGMVPRIPDKMSGSVSSQSAKVTGNSQDLDDIEISSTCDTASIPEISAILPASVSSNPQHDCIEASSTEPVPHRESPERPAEALEGPPERYSSINPELAPSSLEGLVRDARDALAAFENLSKPSQRDSAGEAGAGRAGSAISVPAARESPSRAMHPIPVELPKFHNGYPLSPVSPNQLHGHMASSQQPRNASSASLAHAGLFIRGHTTSSGGGASVSVREPTVRAIHPPQFQVRSFCCFLEMA